MQTHLRQTPPFDHIDFAQEFLRRNPAYATHYRDVVSGYEQHVARHESMNMARTWGLEFPRTF